MSPDPGASQPPRRVTVTSPRMRTSRRARQHLRGEIDAQTRLGQVYMTTLIRAQLRLGLLVLVIVGILLLGLPLVFALVPEVRTVDTLGIPLPWLLLGVLVHPALIGAAWFYVRQAERNEREFADLVDRG
ncbi:DUF485 domain-containing protein [Flindersiella endophytica]